MDAPQTVSDCPMPADELEHAIVAASTRINSWTYELLVLVRQFDERECWRNWGFDNCANWLHWSCDLSLSAAREKVRVARALKALPMTDAEFAGGALSYSKLRALTRVANVENEASLIEFAKTTTAARLEERCRQLRNVRPESCAEANRNHANRSLIISRDAERGTMSFTIEVPVEQGQLISQAVDKAAERAVAMGPELESESWRAQQADALVDIARSYLGGADAGGSSADHYQVIVHIDEGALRGGEGRADLPLESVRRLTCDGSIVGLVERDDGEPIRLGRKQRTVTAAVRRALWSRDGGCRFPGCTHTKYVDVHHVRHWADGGETNPDNLVLLCTRHHRLVHEAGFTIDSDNEGQWYFRRPDGRAIPAFGYRNLDMIDDHLGVAGHASAEEFKDSAMALRDSGSAPYSVEVRATHTRKYANGIPVP